MVGSSDFIEPVMSPIVVILLDVVSVKIEQQNGHSLIRKILYSHCLFLKLPDLLLVGINSDAKIVVLLMSSLSTS